MPVLTATGAGVRHHRRWVFRDLDATVEPGELVAIVGVPGSGRTTVLLALAQRFRLSAGTVKLSAPVALGYVPDVEQPESVFSVAEHVRERLALLGRSARPASAVELYGLDPQLKGWQLTPYQKQVLGLALACLAEPALIILDGVDDGLDSAEQARLWRILGKLTGSGVAVIVTAREIDPNSVATVIQLGDPQAPAPSTEELEAARPTGDPAVTVPDAGHSDPRLSMAKTDVVDEDGGDPRPIGAKTDGADDQAAADAADVRDGEQR